MSLHPFPAEGHSSTPCRGGATDPEIRQESPEALGVQSRAVVSLLTH